MSTTNEQYSKIQTLHRQCSSLKTYPEIREITLEIEKKESLLYSRYPAISFLRPSFGANGMSALTVHSIDKSNEEGFYALTGNRSSIINLRLTASQVIEIRRYLRERARR